MSFTSLKGFYVSNDLDVLLDKLTVDDEEICRIETCILMGDLDSSKFSSPEMLQKHQQLHPNHQQRAVKFRQRTYMHVILTTNGIVLTSMASSNNLDNEGSNSVAIPFGLIKHIERRQTLVSRTEAFRLFGCTPKGREQLYLMTLWVSTSQATHGKRSGCGGSMNLGNCFPSRGKDAASRNKGQSKTRLSSDSSEDKENVIEAPLQAIELLTIEPDSHLLTTSSLLWVEKSVGKKALAQYERKHIKPQVESHKHHHHAYHEVPQHEVNTKFFHSLMTLLDSNRLVNKTDAVALKELVTTMYKVSFGDGIYFKRIFYSSSKAWPAVTERLATWLDFHSRNKQSNLERNHFVEGTDDFASSHLSFDGENADSSSSTSSSSMKIESLEKQVSRWKNGRVYSGNKFRKLKEWPFAFTYKDALPYHKLTQQKWFNIVRKMATRHVSYKIRYLIHLIYFMVKDSTPVQERLYWMMDSTQAEDDRQQQQQQSNQSSGHCFFDLFVMMCACLRLDFIEEEGEMEIISILYYLMKMSEEAAESMDMDPLTFISRCMDSLSQRELEHLVKQLLKPAMSVKNMDQLTYELYQSLYLASSIMQLKPKIVHSLGEQFEVHFTYFFYHQIEAQLKQDDDDGGVGIGSCDKSFNFLKYLYTSQCDKIFKLLKEANHAM